VGDIGLCDTCVARLDRDSSATAFMVAPEKREALRAATIARFGAALELLAPESGKDKSARSRKRR
jgi:hypothetical protein